MPPLLLGWQTVWEKPQLLTARCQPAIVVCCFRDRMGRSQGDVSSFPFFCHSSIWDSSISHVCGEPSAVTLKTFATIQDVADWAGMPAELSIPLFALMGATGTEHPRMLGMVNEEVFNEIKTMLVGDRPPSLMQKGRIRSLIHVWWPELTSFDIREEVE